MKPYKILAAAIIATATMTMGGCSNPQTGATTSQTRSIRAYQLGREDANAILDQCETSQQLRLRLLDIRARITNIRSHAGEDAADEYVTGFRLALEERGDTLAATLFN